MLGVKKPKDWNEVKLLVKLSLLRPKYAFYMVYTAIICMYSGEGI
jgi:hypothetical protein